MNMQVWYWMYIMITRMRILMLFFSNLEDYLDPVYLFQVSIHCLVSPSPAQPIIEKINDSHTYFMTHPTFDCI